MTYVISVEKTGKIQLPSQWRKRVRAKKFFAEETEKGLLIVPDIEEKCPEELQDKNVELYECEENGEKVSGVRFKKGLGKEGTRHLVHFLEEHAEAV